MLLPVVPKCLAILSRLSPDATVYTKKLGCGVGVGRTYDGIGVGPSGVGMGVGLGVATTASTDGLPRPGGSGTQAASSPAMTRTPMSPPRMRMSVMLTTSSRDG